MYTYNITTHTGNDNIFFRPHDYTEKRLLYTYNGTTLPARRFSYPRGAELLAGKNPPEYRKATDGGAFFGGGTVGEQIAPGKPTSVGGTRLAYEYLGTGASDQFARFLNLFIGQGSDAQPNLPPGWGHEPDSAALTELDKWFYPTPAYMIDKIAFSDYTPTYPATGWVLQTQVGHPWMRVAWGVGSEYDACGSARVRQMEAPTIKLANTTGFSRVWHRPDDGMILREAAANSRDYARSALPQNRFGALPVGGTYHNAYGLPPDLTVGIKLAGPPTVTHRYRIECTQYDASGATTSTQYSPANAVPAVGSESQLLTSVAQFATLDATSVRFKFELQIEFSTTPGSWLPQTNAVIWHKVPCLFYGLVQHPGVLEPEGAKYLPGWLHEEGVIS